MCLSDGNRGAAGAFAEAVAGLLCDRRWSASGVAEELEEAEPSSRHTDGGEVVGWLPAAGHLPCSLRWRG